MKIKMLVDLSSICLASNHSFKIIWKKKHVKKQKKIMQSKVFLSEPFPIFGLQNDPSRHAPPAGVLRRLEVLGVLPQLVFQFPGPVGRIQKCIGYQCSSNINELDHRFVDVMWMSMYTCIYICKYICILFCLWGAI